MNKYLSPHKYLYFILNKIAICLHPFIQIFEKKLIKKYSAIPLKHQPVFIIGAPRTGSTILYQTITNQLDVLYIDNIIAVFFRNFFFGFWLSNQLFKQKAHNCFKSDFGDTSKYSLRAPSECGSFWHRWLPYDKDFVDYRDITDNMVEEIQNEITAVINYFDKPIIINNNNIALRIRLIKKAFPKSKFIIADRNPLFVSQSLLKARIYFYNNYNTWWSIIPPNYNELIKEPYFKQVVLQHYYINKQMYIDLKDSEKSYLTIKYKNFCIDKNKIIWKIVELLEYQKVRNNFIDNKIKESSHLNIDNTLLNKIKEEIKRLDWNDYTC